MQEKTMITVAKRFRTVVPLLFVTILLVSGLLTLSVRRSLAQGDIIFEDDFSGNSNSWKLVNNDGCGLKVGGGSLGMTASKTGVFCLTYPDLFLDPNVFVQAEVNPPTTGNGWYAGVVLRSPDQGVSKGFYHFAVKGDGTWYFAVFTGGNNGQYRIKASGKLPNIDLHAPFTLTVTVVKDQYGFEINGQHIGDWKDSSLGIRSIDSQFIGLSLANDERTEASGVGFTRLTVSSAGGSGSTGPDTDTPNAADPTSGDTQETQIPGATQESKTAVAQSTGITTAVVIVPTSAARTVTRVRPTSNPTVLPSNTPEPSATPQPSDTPTLNQPLPQPSATQTATAQAPLPDLTETAISGTVQARAVVLANTLNAEATRFPITATVVPNETFNAPTVVAVVPTVASFQVRDESGAILGNGEVRVYAPPKMGLNETSEIRVEVQVKLPIGGPGATLNPAPSATPVLGTPRPTSTPLPLVDTQFIEVHEFMGAGLRGADLTRFNVDSVPPSGLRNMQPQAINWWKWSISPKGDQALGISRLEVFITLPQRREDGLPLDREVNVIPFNIEVVAPTAKAVDTFISQIAMYAGAIAAIGGAVGVILAAMRFLRDRVKKDKPKQG